MQFVAILPVRDEADIIGQFLDHILTWVDAVYIFDTGSVDNTWEIIQDTASKDSRVKPLRKDPVYFSETRLRGWLFHQARQQLHDGDWFLRVDADEFHHIPPPEFVKTHLRKCETIVYHQYYNFCLRQAEVEDWEQRRETLADRQRPIKDRRRWWTPSVYSEPRMCRYRRTMQWPPTVAFPFNAGYLARQRLPIRHYPHRDPVQLQRRCRLRAVMMADPQNRAFWKTKFHYWQEEDWRKFVVTDNDSNLNFWTRGTELPELGFTQHLARPHKRLVQRLAHALLLPLMDRRRPPWPDGAYPQRIPPEIVAQLQHALAQESAPIDA